MFLYLSKILPQLLQPPALTIFMLLVALPARRRMPKLANGAIVLTIATLWIFSTHAFSDFLIGGLEARFPAIDVPQVPSADAIVVLGGYLHSPTSSHRNTELNESADRLWMGARLFKSGKAPFVLLTGGTVPGFGEKLMPEADAAKILLEDWGVPSSAILVETQSRNTHENALYSRPILHAKNARRVLLVTSAFHMPRAFAIFRKEGIDVIAVPTDYLSGWEHSDVLYSWIPDAEGLYRFSTAAREWIGLTVYKLRGWA